MLYIGKIVNTHGIKGELRILSNFKYKNEIFKINNFLYIDNVKYQIKTYRKHKNYDMVTLDNYNNINDVLFLKNKDVYSLREYVNEILPSDLIDYEVYENDILQGKVKYIMQNKVQDILVLDTNKKIIFLNKFIKKIDNANKKIEVGGIINEN